MSCPNCRSSATSHVLTAAGRAVDLGRCDSCGLVRLEDGATDASLYDYYERRVGCPMDEVYLQLTTDRLVAALRELGELAPGRRMLDVGCGEGQLLHAAVTAGWDALGIDLAPGAIEVCRHFGLPAQLLDLFADDLAAGSFDLVTMIEFIEHVDDPAAFLRRAEELLVPGGILHLTTPNFASLGRRVLGAQWGALSREHLVYFTPATLRSMIGRHTGLETIAVRSRNLSAAALKRLLPARVVPSAAVDTPSYASGGFAEEQRVRHAIEGSSALRAAKSVVNGVLGVAGAGETIVATFRRPSR